MKSLKTVLALLLAMTMVFCMFACGNDSDGTTEPDTSSTTQQTEPQGTEPDKNGNDDPDPVDYVYTVTVKDTEGNPMPNVFVQICAGDSCVPKSTDANGVAGYETEITGDGELGAKIINVPAGYVAVDGITEINMETAGNDVVFVLEKVVYKIVIMENNDTAVTGMKVHISDEAGNVIEGFTDSNGEALFLASDVSALAEGTHTACITELPDNYDYYECDDEIVVDAENNTAFFVLING